MDTEVQSVFRIMMVDDVVRHQRLYESTITDAIPSTVEFATNGEEALQKLNPDSPPDLLILDLNMPKMGGEEVLGRLRKDQAFDRMPVIILTGETDAACHHRLLELGADDFVEKGCSPEIFVARLKNQIRHKQTLDRFTQMAVDMDMFAAGVLHDIRNLESIIVAVCHLASELINEDPILHRAQVLSDLENLEARARKLGIYASDIIKMVRETQKQLVLGPQKIEEALQWCFEVLGVQSEKSSAPQILTWTADSKLEPVLADPQFLRLALLNIIANSIKYARQGSTPHSSLSQSRSPGTSISEEKIVTRIRDNGTGIAEGELRRVFEPFSRGRKQESTEKTSGFGLGLAMVTKVVGAMGGRVWAELPTDHLPGTVVCIELPIAAGGQK